ncbi:MAG: hypothetical protein K2O17_02420 [Bacteroidaceae bacterium]|nr:hypothetical protein [Bacteroidaceae bacterium]
MKKTYMTPFTRVYKVDTQQMLAVSKMDIYADTGTDTETVDDTDDLLVREQEDWDIWSEEDYYDDYYYYY